MPRSSRWSGWLKEKWKDIFVSQVFDKHTKHIQEVNDMIINPIEVAEGAIDCNDCKSKNQEYNKTYSSQLQTRGGDEGITTFVQCFNCGQKWSFC